MSFSNFIFYLFLYEYHNAGGANLVVFLFVYLHIIHLNRGQLYFYQLQRCLLFITA